MGKQWELEFISEGFREILMSSGTKAFVESAAADIQAKANANLSRESEGYEVSTIEGGYGGGRWVSFVNTTDQASCEEESENKALSRAVTG